MKCNFRWKTTFSVLRPFRGFRGNIRCSSYRVTGKRVVDFLLVLIDLFARCYGSATSEYRLKIGVFFSTRSVSPKISGRKVSSPADHSSCQKTRMNDLLCGIRMWAQVSFVLSLSMRLTDRQTDGRTDGKALAIPCTALHAVAR